MIGGWWVVDSDGCGWGCNGGEFKSETSRFLNLTSRFLLLLLFLLLWLAFDFSPSLFEFESRIKNQVMNVFVLVRFLFCFVLLSLVLVSRCSGRNFFWLTSQFFLS